MAVKDKLTEEFLRALDEVEVELFTLQLKRYSLYEKGLACFVEYKKENNTRVEFMLGPADWNIEMIIYTSKGKFAFKDLLSIPKVIKWVDVNRYKQKNGRNVKKELLWFVELLRISLPMVE